MSTIWLKLTLMIPIASFLLYFFVQIMIDSAHHSNEVEIFESSHSIPDDNRAIVEETEYNSRYDGIPHKSDSLHQWKEIEVDSEDVHYEYDFEVDRIVRDIENTTAYALKNGLPMVVWWTPFTGEEGSVKKCSEGSCYFTQDRKYWNHSLTQTLVFYGTNMDTNDLPLPRKHSHEWAILHEESPKNNLLFHHEEFIKLFNHTCTFRQHSDYPITTQYLSSLAEIQRKPVMDFTQKTSLNLSSTIFLQSGCNPPSDRDAYIHELMKYLKVDSYGACLKNKELPAYLKSPLTMHDDSLQDFVGQYKFALTFENAICDDYITEKLWRPLAAGAIPVYKGAPNILEWLPEKKSVILVDDFKNPEELAKYLDFLANNETEYNKYLSFKDQGITNQRLVDQMRLRPWGVNDIHKMSFITGFECLICDRAHRNRQLKERDKRPINFIAKNDHYGCPRPTRYEYEPPPGAESWEREIWSEEFEEMKNKARDLYEKVSQRGS